MTTAQEILTRWGQFFAQSQFWTDPIVNISWWIIWLLKELVDAANYLLQVIYKMSDFIFTDTVVDFLRSFNNLLWIPFTIALLVLGYTLIFHATETRPKVVQNLLIAIMVLCALPTMMISIKDMTFAGIDLVNNYSISESGESETTSYAEKIILDNLADLKYMDAQGWDENTLIRKKNNLTSIYAADITERLWADQVSSTDDVFDKYLKYDENGNVSVENIDRSSWIWILSPVYYRYNFNFISMFLALIASAIALFFTAYKTARLIWELAYNQLLAVIFAASDLTNGQKTKEVLRNIANIFVVLFLTSTLLQFFQLGVHYINNQNINGLARGFILLFWALAAVDGPNIIERLLGIDAGISSGFRTFFGVVHGAHTAVGLGKAAGRTVKKGGRAYTAAAGRSGMFKEHYQRFATRNKQNSIHARKKSPYQASRYNGDKGGYDGYSSGAADMPTSGDNGSGNNSPTPSNFPKTETSPNINGFAAGNQKDIAGNTTVQQTKNSIAGFEVPTKSTQKRNNSINATHNKGLYHTDKSKPAAKSTIPNDKITPTKPLGRFVPEKRKENTKTGLGTDAGKENLKRPPNQDKKGRE